jgi:LPXTG-motif cell wall-anchored protein
MRKRLMVAVATAGLLILGLGPAASAQLGLPGDGAANQATGGGLEAAAIGQLGDTEHGPIVDTLLDLPALNVGVDAEGRVVMDLPGLKLVGPADPAVAPPPAPPVAPVDPVDPAVDRPAPTEPAPRALPVTGMEAGDMAAAGLAALALGGWLLRRMRVSVLG